MFTQFGTTAETLSKASTMVFRIGTDAHLYDDPDDVNIAQLLDSKFDSEKCEALKRLLALIAQGFDVSNFFPQVVKNVASQSLEVKKLVYLYLLHYAEKRPSEALLSINCFQKDLGDPNPLVRAWALRTMAGIRVHAIAPLVLVAVCKCARDPSVYVRKCAANALPKLHDLRQEENTSAIEEVVGILLKDHSPGVVGAAAAAFASVCPNNLSLIGRNFRRLCEILPDVEEWGQIILIGILLRYVIARHGLVRESIMFSLHGAKSSHLEKDAPDGNFISEKNLDDTGVPCDYELANTVSWCYIEGPDEYLSRSSYRNKVLFELVSEQFTSSKGNDDVKILLHCTSPLFWSNNSAVVLAAAGVHWIMAPREDLKRIVKPVLFVLRSSSASKYVVLRNIQVFAKAMPSLFSPHFEDFFISSSDSYQVKALKLEILSSIATYSSISSIFKEFQDYVRDPDRQFAADTVAAIGSCAQRMPKMANTCIQGLLALIRQDFLINDFDSGCRESDVLVQAIFSMKSIIKQDPPTYEKVIIQLVRSLDSIRAPSARAMIIWMLGEYCDLGDVIARTLTTVLKYLAWCFTSEASETKLQILNTTVKVVICTKGEDLWTFKKIFSYILELSESDLNYDVRDRARFLKKFQSCYIGSQVPADEADCVLQNKDLPQIVAEFVFETKTKSASPEPTDLRFYLPGSLSQIVLHAAPGYEPLPKPCSLLLDDLSVPERVDKFGNLAISRDSYDTDHGSSDESSDGNASDYSAQHSVTGSSGREYSDETDSVSEGGDDGSLLIQLSEAQNASENQNGASASSPGDVGELMSSRTLESWLNEQHVSSIPSISKGSHFPHSSARISIGDLRSRVKPKIYSLLDPVIGNGLKADYSFSSEISNISPLLICVEVSFKNCSSEPMPGISLADEESNKAFNSMDQSKALKSADESLAADDSLLRSHDNVPAVIPTDTIASLEPDQEIKRILQVRFHHHLLPVKLTLFCNGKNLAVKLRPDIGYFVKPLPMDSEAFMDKESHLPGMFEYTRSCTFTDHLVELSMEKVDSLFSKDSFLVICQSLALKMLQHANVCLVSVDMPVAGRLDDASGLHLRFCGEILSSSLPCLISVIVEGKCYEPLNLSVKVNCEETVFGLNLLNRIVNFLSEPSK